MFISLRLALKDTTKLKESIASSILLNIKGGLDLALFEVDEAASLIRSKVNENANIIFGSSIDESLEGIINISVVATGINQSFKNVKEIETDTNQEEQSDSDNEDQFKELRNKFQILGGKVMMMMRRRRMMMVLNAHLAKLCVFYK